VAPEPAAGFGTVRPTSTSPGASAVWPGPRNSSASGSVRSPPGPATRAVAPSTISDGTTSAEGAALQTFPPIVPLLRIWTEPTRSAPSTRPGQPRLTASDQAISPQVTIEPIESCPFVSRLVSDSIQRNETRSGTGRPRSFIWMSRSVPPASGRAFGLLPRS
jgi:hypothetical protein